MFQVVQYLLLQGKVDANVTDEILQVSVRLLFETFIFSIYCIRWLLLAINESISRFRHLGLKIWPEGINMII